MLRDAPTTDWSPAQYERFKSERSQPFFDLLALVRPRAGMRVVDLGSGTGELTRAMHERLSAAATVGVDASDAMLERSRAFEAPGLTFARGDIATWTPPSPVDLVFSNAAIQWVDGHEALLGRLSSLLAPGGQIAVQIPANDDHPSHTVAAEIASESPFRDALRGHVRVFPNLTLDGYAALLDRLGFEAQHVRMQVYAHRLPAAEDVIEWVKGSLLTDYEKRLEPAMYTQFLARYRERLLDRLGEARPFFFPFKRILFHATR
jgi:trans-aconitate 2-methyltransferase